MFIAGFWATKEEERDSDIHYYLMEENSGFFVECAIEGTAEKVAVPLFTANREQAEQEVAFLAKKAVHPFHLEDIIADAHL